MDKELMDKFRELKIKEREEKKSKKFQDTLTLAKQAIQRTIEKEQRTMFNQVWSTIIVKASECLHNNLQYDFIPILQVIEGLVQETHLHIKNLVDNKKMARMQLAGHVPAKL